MKKFKRGDLVREVHLNATAHYGYGIILTYVKAGSETKYKCLWLNENVVWFKSHQLYLIARGQNGIIS
jgi:hypothetical protein